MDIFLENILYIIAFYGVVFILYKVIEKSTFKYIEKYVEMGLKRLGNGKNAKP